MVIFHSYVSLPEGNLYMEYGDAWWLSTSQFLMDPTHMIFKKNNCYDRFISIKPFLYWLMWVKQCHKPSPSHHHFYRWYKPINHSQSWVVNMTLFYPDYISKSHEHHHFCWLNPTCCGSNSQLFPTFHGYTTILHHISPFFMVKPPFFMVKCPSKSHKII